jgi:hypothetical protein
LGVYGFKIVDDDEKSSVFSKLSAKKEIEEPLSSELNVKSTLELFIKKNYDVTTIQSDTEWAEDFEEKYIAFCSEYRLSPESIRVDELGTKYNLDILNKPRKKVTKNIEKKIDDKSVVGV